MKVKSESEVVQSCPTPSDPMDCSPPSSSAHGIFQARVLEWGAIAFSGCHIRASLIAQLVKNLPAMRKTLVRVLGQEDPLVMGKATYSSILAWRISWTVWSMGSQKSQTQLRDFHFSSLHVIFDSDY